MKNVFKILILLCLLCQNSSRADDFKYILHDKCINQLRNIALSEIHNNKISIIRDSQGIILRFGINNLKEAYYNQNEEIKENIDSVKYFLAKIKNPVIIEVHTDGVSEELTEDLRNWEISTVIANNAEALLLASKEGIERDRIVSVGYGEFLPYKNTPNNGGKFPNRIDIIILCNISGE